MADGSIGTIYVELGARMEGLENALKAMNANLLAVKEKTQKWGDKFKEVGKTLTIAGGAITAALSAIVIKTAKVGDEFDEMSAKTGISTETLSTLKLAADKSGTSIDAVAAGMKFLATQMIEASTATDKSKTVLGALGISATNASGKLRPMNDVLFDVADRFAGMEAGALKTKLAVTIFGRAGMDMIPILNLGRGGLEENEAAARRLGIEWSGASSRAASKFADAVVDLKAAGAGLGQTIASLLMPMVQKFVEGATKAIVSVRTWAAAHPELAKALSSVALATGGVLTILGTMLLAIPKLVTSFGALASALKVSAAALTASIAGLTAVAAAAVFAYTKINELIRANEQATEADYDASVANDNLGKKLRAVADAAGITRAEFVALTEKYGGNNAALAMAIQKGKEGVAMQTALSTVGKEHAATLKTQAASTGTFDTELSALIDSMSKGTKETKSLKDELGLIFTSDLKARINQIETALIAYKVKLSPETEKKLREELALLTTQLKTAGTTVKNEVNPPFSALEQQMLDMAKPTDNYDAILKDFNDTLTLIGENAKKSPEPHKEATKEIGNAWAEVCLQLAKDISTAFAGMLSGTTTFADGMKSIIGNLAASIGQAIGTQISTALSSIGAMAGPLGSLVGGIIGGILSIFGTLFKAAETYAEYAQRIFEAAIQSIVFSLNYLGAVSGATAELIMNYAEAWMNTWGVLADSMGGQAMADAIATTMYLSELMADTGISIYNFAGYMDLASLALTQYSQGLITAEQASGTLNDAFSALQQAAQELGLEGSDAMVDFILQAREAGLEIASVTEYVQETLSKIPDALATMADNIPALADKLAVLTDKLAEQEAALAKLKPGSQEYLNMLAAIAETKAGIDAVTAAYQGNADTIAKAKNAGVLALTTFNSMIASGMSWGDALAALAPTLATLKARYEDLGLAADPALQQLMNIAKVREEHKALFDNIDANLQVMQALANTGYLTAEALAAIESNAKQYYKNLIKAGMSADDATRAMAPTLQAIYDAHKKSGEPIDKNTQKLIDQAKALGLIKEETPDPGTVMAQGMNRLVVILEAIAKALGATIPAAAEDGADAISQAMGNAADDVTKDMGTAATDVKKALGAAAIDTGKAWGTALTGITDGPMKDLIGGAGDAQKEWEGAAKGAIKAWGGVKIPGTTGLTGGNVGGAGIKAYAEGGVAWTPQLATVAEREPEIIMPLSDYQSGTGLAAGVGSGASAGAGRGVTINYAPVIQAMDSQDVHRFMAGKGRDAIVGILRSNLRGLAREFAVETSKYGGR